MEEKYFIRIPMIENYRYSDLLQFEEIPEELLERGKIGEIFIDIKDELYSFFTFPKYSKAEYKLTEYSEACFTSYIKRDPETKKLYIDPDANIIRFVGTSFVFNKHIDEAISILYERQDRNYIFYVDMLNRVKNFLKEYDDQDYLEHLVEVIFNNEKELQK